MTTAGEAPDVIAGIAPCCSGIRSAETKLSLTTAGVVVALTFVASPFYVRQAMASFAAVDRSLLDASRTLGAPEARGFLRVMIPVALPGLAAGTALVRQTGFTFDHAFALVRYNPDGSLESFEFDPSYGANFMLKDGQQNDSGLLVPASYTVEELAKAGWDLTNIEIVSGDTANDLMMFLQGFRGIVVANAHRELKELSGEKVYVSPYAYAEGVLDGLRYWLSHDERGA